MKPPSGGAAETLAKGLYGVLPADDVSRTFLGPEAFLFQEKGRKGIARKGKVLAREGRSSLPARGFLILGLEMRPGPTAPKSLAPNTCLGASKSAS